MEAESWMFWAKKRFLPITPLGSQGLYTSINLLCFAADLVLPGAWRGNCQTCNQPEHNTYFQRKVILEEVTRENTVSISFGADCSNAIKPGSWTLH